VGASHETGKGTRRWQGAPHVVATLEWSISIHHEKTFVSSLLFSSTPEVINRRIGLDTLPNLLNPLCRLRAQLALLDPLRRLLNLLDATRADNDAVLLSLYPIPLGNGRMVRNPPIRQFGLAHSLLVRNLVPLDERRAQTGLVVQLRVQAANGLRIEAARARVEVRSRLGQEAARDGRVGVEDDTELLEEREEGDFEVARGSM
jgi:hypothetical protein